MPNLNWIGKEVVINHDKEIPFRLLKKNKSESFGKNSQNLIIHGDNLEALKALMPYYQGRIKCIYIDPPYNTGNEGWVYNDKVNSPKIKKWLGQTVGGESEDLCRHDKWLCMMYPRLKLLYQLLTEDGLLFASIDDNEFFNLRILLTDIFGENNFIAVLPTIMNLKGNQDQFGFAGTHEYTLVFSKNKSKCKILDFIIEEDEELELWQQDEIGFFKKGANLKSTGINAPRAKRPYLFYPLLYNSKSNCLDFISDDEYKKIYNPTTKKFDDKFLDKLKEKYEKKGLQFILPITDGEKMTWRWEIKKIKNEQYNIIIKSNGEKIVIYKKQRPAIGDIPTKRPKTLFYKPEYSSGNGTAQMKRIFGQKIFDNPKPMDLIKDIIQISTDKNDFVLDSFAGSGTTADAVIKLNTNDGGKRKFILIQLEETLKEPIKLRDGRIIKKVIDICKERVKWALKEYNSDDGFEYCELDKPLFDENGQIDEECTFEQLATYIFFTETNTNLDKKTISDNSIGEYNEVEYYLLFKEKGKNILNKDFLKKISRNSKKKVVYADKCLMDEKTLNKHNILFKQIPYEVKVY
jgi:adenine-specific DNA-methyltransferase